MPRATTASFETQPNTRERFAEILQSIVDLGRSRLPRILSAHLWMARRVTYNPEMLRTCQMCEVLGRQRRPCDPALALGTLKDYQPAEPGPLDES